MKVIFYCLLIVIEEDDSYITPYAVCGKKPLKTDIKLNLL